MTIHLTLATDDALVGLATLTLLVAGTSFIAYDLSVTRRRLSRRVEALRQARAGAMSQAGGVTAGSTRRVRRPSWLAVSQLPAGDELELARRLQQIPFAADHATALLLAFRLTAAVMMGVLLSLLAYTYKHVDDPVRLLALACFGGGLGWFAPHLILGRLIANRKKAIEQGLPDAIELLVIAVEAGLALEDGIDRIIAELKRSRPVLAEELALTSADLKILPSRDVALQRLAERADVPSLRSIVTTLSQTMRYGTPLAQALRVVAAELRNDALMHLEEQANRMPVLMTVPMVVFILPSVFLLIGGPTFLRLFDTFFSMNH